MSSTQDIAHTSEFPEELSHLSIPGHPHREPASDFVHEGNTLPMPPAPNSPVPTLPSLDSHLLGSELGLGYVRVDLPQDNPFLFTHGRPLLDHYMEGTNAAINRDYWFKIPSAAKSYIVKEEDVTIARQYHMLQVFRESFPVEAGHAVLIIRPLLQYTSTSRLLNVWLVVLSLELK